MNCPKCTRPMKYLNQDYRTHGWYCLESSCKSIEKCDKWCCTMTEEELKKVRERK